MGEVSNPQKILLVSVLIIMCVFCLSAEAKYGGGTGEPNYPYLIYTAEQMNEIGLIGNSDDWDKHFRLMADIDLSGFDGLNGNPPFNIIGNFTGMFDGNGYTISNFTYITTGIDLVGLFRRVSGENAEIKDLGLINANIDAGTGNNVGGLVGWLGTGDINESHGTIRGCYVEGGNVSGGEFVGGLMGRCDGTISDCYYFGDVRGYFGRVGGLIGLKWALASISNCHSSGEVRGDHHVGGLAGHTSDGRGNLSVDFCYSSSNVFGNYLVGGLVGYNTNPLTNCYATGNVSGNDYVGGLLGDNTDVVVNCYSVGNVSGNSNVGGLVGRGWEGNFFGCFWDIESSGQVNSDVGTGRTTVDMQIESTFTDAGWDFTTPVWKMCYGPYYPKLWWETCPERLTYYVDVDATGVNNGSNWADAYNHLQDALAAAKCGDEILVAQGTYKPGEISSPHPPPPPPPGIGGSNETETTVTDSNRTDTFQLKNGVIIKGGYAGFGEPDSDARDIEKYKTILSGDLAGNDRDVNEPGELLNDPCRADNSYHVVTGSGAYHYVVLDGFTITGGNANGTDPNNRGGGMYNDNGRPTVTNCTFSGNSTSNLGAGVHNRNNSNPMFINCTFNSNFAAWAGGGMFNYNISSPTVSSCTFSNNSANHRGGGMYNYSSSPTVTNSTFIGNSANIGMGGWMFNFDSNPTVSNCTFSGNSAKLGGGLANIESNPTLTNCILWGDEPNEIFDGALSSTIVTYSNVHGGWPGQGNIDADPCFADANNGDCHLKSQAGRWEPNSQTWIKDSLTSPCIDVGDWDSDWSGELWPHGERINMGAFGGTPEASMSLSDEGSIADLNNDGKVDYRDMKLLTDKWPYKALLQPEDLSRDGIVNFADFAIFSRILGLPGPAINPNPPDGAGISNLDTDLSWTAGPYAESHDIYFGTSSPPPWACNQTSTTFDPGTMAAGTKYYWRIDEVSACGTITGTVWSFTTMIPPPP